ncbi:MAG: Asp23/Gls24 family envelope stress response protein [Candidatus Omnitrophota bacterium]|jgi:uncharacterized alkaline shock family protein YloU
MLDREEARTELGIVKIHKNVISNIASIAALDVEGVKDIGKNLKNRIREFINKTKYTSIRVDFDKNGQITLDIPLIIKYGYNIPEVAAKTQENVHNALDKMTSLMVRDINIRVQGIDKE